MTTLPDKPSELIRLAIADLEKCEKDDRYEIDMYAWHQPDRDTGVCLVCLAGSVIASTLGGDRKTRLYPADYIDFSHPADIDFSDSNKLSALNNFRAGYWREGLSVIRADTPNVEGLPHPVPYDENPAAFKADMLRAADILAEAGL